MSLENSFKNKCVLITGAGKGIGRALTQRLHSYGAKVYAVSRTMESLSTLKEECPNIVAIELDVGLDWEKTREIVATMKDVDVVINNAAITDIMKPFLEMTEQDYDAMLNVNLKAVTIISQTAAKNMLVANKGGAIVNISSIAAIRAFDKMSLYCISKAALDMLTKSMAFEFGKHKISVNAINLGGVKTNAIDKYMAALSEEDLKKMMEFTKGKSLYGNEDFLPMDEVVNNILYTASGLAGSLTGACIVHDGGAVITSETRPSDDVIKIR